ncbi:MAG: hypothetical protein RMJ28_05035 [Nitrososphaerota archaeon]|nr:hypothetical protein [Candidatus Calditenuaceae archaeon]MDW8073585.1 hypothetical protein [Nitrososphaerota archaeon]
MRRSSRLLLAASLALLVLAFTIYQGVSSPISGLSSAMPGSVPVFELTVHVQLLDPSGVARPDSGAQVTVGLFQVRTDASGLARLSLPAGRYSAFVKSSDARLLPLTLELVVDRNMTLDVQFKLAKMYPEEVILSTGSGSTEMRMILNVPEGGRLFISYPQVSGLTPTGEPVKMTRGVDGFSNFFQRVSPGPLVLDLKVERELATVDAGSTFVPLQIIEWRLSP